MPVSINNTQVVFNDATTQTTAGYPNSNPSGFTSNTGTVTSVATGNGLSGGTITSSGTLVIAAPSSNSVGSYCFASARASGGTITFGSNYSAGTGINQISLYTVNFVNNGCCASYSTSGSISGTWRWMASTFSHNSNGEASNFGIAVRVA